jgi:hypothetical protein
MRFLLVHRLDESKPDAYSPSPEVVAGVGRMMGEMTKAGVLLAAEGVLPSSTGALVRASGGRRTVTDGPFTEAKELVAGYLLIQVQSKEEAIEWASRCPVEYAVPPGMEAIVEVRQVAEMADLPTATEEQRAREQSRREAL